MITSVNLPSVRLGKKIDQQIRCKYIFTESEILWYPMVLPPTYKRWLHLVENLKYWIQIIPMLSIHEYWI